MSVRIDERCVTCGACVWECPTEAISPGAPRPIVDESACTECYGFFGESQCVVVCPVDAICVSAEPVTVAPVIQKSVPLEIQGIGTVIAATTVAVRAQITGEMTSVHFKEGEDVTQGQVLVELDKRPLQAALAQAEATLQRDIAQANNAKASAARYKDLQQRGIATSEQVDQITSQAAALEATVNADKAIIQNARVQLDYATIQAPISGRTGLLQVHPGNLVRGQDTNPIVTINRITPVYVSFAIPEAQLPILKKFMAGGQLNVRAQPSGDTGAPSVGRVNFIDNSVDITTGTIKVKGTFPNEDRRLWPGQFVNVTVTLTSDPTAVVVPSAAVQTISICRTTSGPTPWCIRARTTTTPRAAGTRRLTTPPATTCAAIW